MPHIFTPEQQKILTLSKTTYQSSSTMQIAHATQQIKTFIIQNYPRSFPKLQTLLTLKEQVDLNTRKSLTHHIKTVSLQLKQLLQNQAQRDNEVLNNNKKLLHDVEHILANTQIEGELKQPIAQAYVQIFALFMPQSYDKLISKARFYFNTKEDIVGLHVLESYQSSSALFKYKWEFNAKVTTLLSEYIHQKLKTLLNNTIIDNSKHLVYLEAHFKCFVDFWTSMQFQKYESIFMKQLTNKNLGIIFEMGLDSKFPQHLLSYIYLVFIHVIPGLRRTGLYKKLLDFSNLLQKYTVKVFNVFFQKSFLQNDMKQEREVITNVAGLKFLIAAVDVNNQGFHLIRHKCSVSQLYGKIIYPNFKNIQKYLNNHSSNLQEVYAFLDDISFKMNSQNSQILIHKFLYNLAKNSALFLADIKIIIYSFLFGYLSLFGTKVPYQLKIKYDVSASLPFWQNISNLISIREQLLSILCITALNVTYFLNDIEFLTDLNDFMGLNAQFFLLQDMQVEFFSLLLYRNYRSDIFSNQKARLFKGYIIKRGLQLDSTSINRKFILKILEQQFNDSPRYSDVSFCIQHILSSMANNFDEELLEILIVLVRNYSQELKKVSAIKQITEYILIALDKWASGQILIKQVEKYLQLIGVLIFVEKQSNYQIIFTKLLQILGKVIEKVQIRGQFILDLLTKALKNAKLLPQNIQILLVNLTWQFTNISVINQFTQIIKYSTNSAFLNWLMQKLCKQDFTIHIAFLMEMLAYYKGSFLSRQTIRSLLAKIYEYRLIYNHQLNYIHGKLNLVCLFVLKWQRNTVYQLFQHQSWVQFQNGVRNKKRLMDLFANQNQIPQFHIIEQFFHIIYHDENLYRWKLDIQIFLITQLKMFQTALNDEYQLAYANVAMVACITNVLRAFEHYQAQSSQFIVQAQGEEAYYKQYCQYIDHSQLIESFEKPEEFNEDYFVLLRNWIQKLKSNNQSIVWLETILKKTFSQQDRDNLQTILKMQKCRGQKIRNIVKVKKLQVQI